VPKTGCRVRPEDYVRLDKGQFTLLESRVDWLTATSPLGERATQLLDLGLNMIREYEKDGNAVKPWRWQGYRGSSAAGLAVGWRLDGACLVASSERANLVAPGVLQIGARARRIDLCVTVVAADKTVNLVRDGFRQLEQSRDTGAAPRRADATFNLAGGGTLYIGDRSNVVFGRIYDKHRESGGAYPKGAWRFEIELKGSAALGVGGYLTTVRDWPAWITSAVAAYFERLGVHTPVRNDLEVEAFVPPRPRTDVDRLKNWCANTVAPALATLGVFETEQTILELLGLPRAARAVARYNADMEGVEAK
jgi:hypothetical protein